MLMTYLGGFSTVLYVLKLAISCCIPTKVFEKERSLSFTMVPSIHAKRSVIILSYSSFKFSISTRMPIILGRKVTKVSQKKRSSCADHLYLVQTSPSCLFSLHLWKVMIIGDKVSHNRLVIRFSHRKIWRERKREEEVVILETSPFCTVLPTFVFHKILFHIMRKKQVFSRLGYCHLSHAWTGLTVTLPSASSSLGRPSSLSAMSNALLRQAMGSFGFRASKSMRSGLWASHTSMGHTNTSLQSSLCTNTCACVSRHWMQVHLSSWCWSFEHPLQSIWSQSSITCTSTHTYVSYPAVFLWHQRRRASLADFTSLDSSYMVCK